MDVIKVHLSVEAEGSTCFAEQLVSAICNFQYLTCGLWTLSRCICQLRQKDQPVLLNSWLVRSVTFSIWPVVCGPPFVRRCPGCSDAGGGSIQTTCLCWGVKYKISCCGLYHIFPGVKRLLINEKAKSLAVVIVLYLLEEIQFFVACLFVQET